MSDILGPANAANAVTVRPADTRSFLSQDTWFKDCTSALTDDGTDVEAGWLNGVVASLRVLWRGNGNRVDGVTPIVPELGTDDNGVLKSVQHMVQRGQVRFGVATGTNDIAVSLTPALIEYVTGLEIIIKPANKPTGAMTVNVSGLGAKALLRRNGTPMQANDLFAGASYAIIYDGTAFRLATFAEGEVLRFTTQDPTVYVRTDGNDNNDGSANDAAHAFATIDGAMLAAARTLNLSGRTLKIVLGLAGTYQGVGSNGMRGIASVSVESAGPAGSFILSNSSFAAPAGVVNVSGAFVSLKNLTLNNANATTHTLQAAYGGAVNLAGTIIFAGPTSTQADIRAFSGGSVSAGAAVQFARNVGYAMYAQGSGASITFPTGSSIQCFGNAWSAAMAGAASNGTIELAMAAPPSGTASGQRYIATLNGVINTGSGSATFFPGSVAGTTTTGGQYV